MLNMLKYRKKDIIAITIILLFALIPTYYIYYKFKDLRDVDYNTETIDVTFHEKTGNKVDLLKITPVTDSVGLSSKAYTFTIKNTTNKSLNYEINVLDNKELVDEDECGEYKIPKNLIKFSIHKKGEKNNIYTLSDLVNGKVVSRVIKANSEEEYVMRFWISNDSTITSGTKLHYHATIVVTENGTKIV